MRIALVAIGLALAASAQVASAQAAPPPHYRLHTAAELSRLCATSSSESDQVTAVAFCHGVLAGAYGYFVSVTPAADRFVCPPNPAPTRTQVANGFVAWLKARPQYNNDGAIDALFRYAAEAFPCKR
jgi:Rap1a immunity proteins